MEIKTCEEYVLAELQRLTDENEQLKEARYGKKTCTNISPSRSTDMQYGMAQFRCSECGCELFMEYDSSKVRIRGCFLVIHGNTEYVPVKYCPNCGRRVKQ